MRLHPFTTDLELIRRIIAIRSAIAKATGVQS
jgi:hypothetical protein